MPEPTGLGDPHDWPPFSVPQAAKRAALLSELERLTDAHALGCRPYRALLDKLEHRQPARALEDLPFIPVRLFKHEKLLSVPEADVVKTLTSSGTSGQKPSQIDLDRQTAALQSKVLARIVGDFLGPRRLPMLVVDAAATVSERARFSARTAGIRGFSVFGQSVEYALSDGMTLDLERVRAFAARHGEGEVLLFGFTFIVWQHLVRALEEAGTQVSLSKGVLVHGGGWKQLRAQAVDAPQFAARLRAVTGVRRVHGYYGMVEQTGSIFMECEAQRLHASTWSEVIIRDPLDFRPLPPGQRGLIQLLSVLPRSYPGHSLLSEDEGEILGVDDCACGRKGTTFRVHGRLEDAEARGCSDTYTR